ncbi:hypothetical protein K0M31_018693 [Melipona bicolor]|uniref:Uncharacterized protein n=1 Tax=Melipona bicolor TaxID=60889 RepID=A0AA40KS62_9HYME|nr:hypothetical protein K0M31_018693 [Melipona bicolor]
MVIRTYPCGFGENSDNEERGYIHRGDEKEQDPMVMDTFNPIATVPREGLAAPLRQ